VSVAAADLPSVRLKAQADHRIGLPMPGVTGHPQRDRLMSNALGGSTSLPDRKADPYLQCDDLARPIPE
jgi:hypothetical protein